MGDPGIIFGVKLNLENIHTLLDLVVSLGAAWVRIVSKFLDIVSKSTVRNMMICTGVKFMDASF